MKCMNCGEMFYLKHLERIKKMPICDVIDEYIGLRNVLNCDYVDNIHCLDEMLVIYDLITEYMATLYISYIGGGKYDL